MGRLSGAPSHEPIHTTTIQTLVLWDVEIAIKREDEWYLAEVLPYKVNTFAETLEDAIVGATEAFQSYVETLVEREILIETLDELGVHYESSKSVTQTLNAIAFEPPKSPQKELFDSPFRQVARAQAMATA